MQSLVLFEMERRMTKIKKWRIVIIIAVLSLIIITAGSTVAFLRSQGYHSNFQDQKNWQVYAGSEETAAKQSQGVLQMNVGIGNKWINQQEKTDFEASVSVRIQTNPVSVGEGELPDAGLLFRVQEDSLSDGTDVVDGYYFGIDLYKQQVFLKQGDSVSQKWQEIATKQHLIEADTDYRLTVKVAGNHIIGFVDERKDSWPVIDVVAEDFAEGLIGVQNQQLQTAFTKFSIKGYEESEGKEATYQNPLLPEIADPDVLYWEGTYYLYATTPGTNIGGIKVYTSKDLVNWEDAGMAMTAGPDNWGTEGFWAPDLIEKDGRFYMYYTANEHLCVSIADNPLGPFKQENVAPMHEDIQEIDAHAYLDDDGQYYLYFVRFNNGNLIYGAKLNDDMQTIDEESIVEVLAPSQAWEQDMANINEGPYMLKHEGKYYLTYSGSHFESPLYGAGYAVSDSPLGPFEKYTENPIMQSNSLVHGAGHHAVAESPDGKELFMIYHRHQTLYSTDPREFAIDRMRFTENAKGETVLQVYGPTVTPQPYPSGAK